jgi:hypothetical protein
MFSFPRKQTFLAILSPILFLTSVRTSFCAELVGKVVDAQTGQGISGAVLRAIPQQGKIREVRGKTDVDGKYHLELLRGNYRLHVSLPDSIFWPRFYSATGNEKGDVLPVPSFDSYLELDIPLQSGGSISGTVRRQKDGSPLPDVHVYAEAGEARVSALTRSDGSYFLRPLPPGEFHVHVVTLDENYIPVYYDNRLDPRKAELLPIHDREELTDIDFLLELGGLIRGKVSSRSSRTSLAGAKIVAEKLKSQEPPRYALSDAKGYYTLRGLTPGKYLLECSLRQEMEAEARSGNNFLLEYYQGGMERDQAETLDVQAESVTNEVNFELVEESRISGRVWSPYQKTAIKNVGIRPRRDHNETLNLSDGQSDTNGRYLIDHLPPGKYRLETILAKANQRFVPVYYRNRLNLNLADILDISEGSWFRSIDFDLTLGASIKGVVKAEDPAYRLEPDAVVLHLKPEGLDIFQYGEHEMKTQPDGAFFLSGIPAGRYQIFPFLKDPNLMPESDSGSRILPLAEGDTLEGVEFIVRIGGSISGTVSSQDSRYPPEKLSIILISIKEQTQKIFPLKSEQYLIAGLNPGKYLMILTTTPQEISPDRPIPPAMAFDSRYVDVARGGMSKGVDFLIKTSSDGMVNLMP